MIWGTCTLPRNGCPPAIGGGGGPGGLIVVSRRNHLLNCPGGSTACFPLPARITTNRAQQSSPMMGGTHALPRNGRPPTIGGGGGHGGLIVVSQRKPLKSPLQKYCIFFPPSSNHNKPRAAVVTHVGGNACFAPERAYSSHGRQ